MAKHKVNLDSRIHRTVIIGQNISSNPSIEVIPETDASGNFLKITKAGDTRRIKCRFIFTPPNIGTKIKQRDSGNQHECDLDDANRRTFELGAELSGTAGTSIIFISRVSPTAGTKGDLLLVSTATGDDTTSDDTIDIGGTKIPPNTGKDLAKPKKAVAKKKKAAPAKKKAVKKK